MPDPAVWGDVATWFGSVGTTGALFLGLLLFRTEQKKAERAQASRVFVWEVNSLRRKKPNVLSSEIRVFIWNRSDAPIYLPQAEIGQDGHASFSIFTEGQVDRDETVLWLAPDTQAVAVLPRSSDATFSGQPRVSFTDISGVDWEYLITIRKMRRLRRGVLQQRQWARVAKRIRSAE